MAGNTANAALWTEADVYIAPVGTANPTDINTAFGVGWELVGLLDGDQGFTQSRDEEKSEYYAWGGILVRTARRNFKLTISFTALEDNATTRSLIWPDSTATSLVVPRPAEVKIAFEKREGTTKERLITANYGEVEVDGDIVENESSLSTFPMIATIYPDAGTSPATLFTRQETV